MKHCEDIKLLLPWLANGTLQADEKLQVLSHLSQCPECRKELASVICLRDSATSVNATMDSDKIEKLFASIVNQINKEASEETDEQNIVSDLLQNLQEFPLLTALLKPVADKVQNTLGMNLVKVKEAVMPALRQLKATGSLYTQLLYVLNAQ